MLPGSLPKDEICIKFDVTPRVSEKIFVRKVLSEK